MLPPRGDEPETPEIDEMALPEVTETPEVRIGAGSALDLAARVIGLGTSFLLGVLVARLFGVAGKGTLAVIVQVPGILVVALDLGITTSIIYFVSRRELRPGTAAANALLLAAVLGVLGAPIVFLLLSGPMAIVPGVPLATTLVAITILPLGLVAAWLMGVSTGLSNLVLPLRYSIASSLTTLAGLAILVGTGRGSITSVLVVSVTGTVVGIVVLFIGLRPWLHPLRPDPSAARRTARFSAKAYLSNIAGLLHERQDLLLLGWLAGAGAVGLYSVGVSFAELTWYVPSALSAAILAKGSRRSDSSAVDYTTRTTRVAILFMGGTALISLLAVPLLIPLIYGKPFGPGVFAFFALLPGVLADGVSRILWSYQTTRGRLYWRLAVGTMALNVIALLALVPRLGAVGAGLASSISYSVLAVLVVRRFCADTDSRASDVLLPRRSDLEIILRTARQALRPAHGR